MFVFFKNIQGFKGEYYFDLKNGINEITAKKNGTGKTTFFECIKVLIDNKYMPRENIRFLRNLTETESQFYVKDDRMLSGFLFNSDNKLIYVRKYPDKDIEYSYEPFDTTAEHLNIFYHNGYFLNVMDKTSNMFSATKPDKNFELVEQLLKTSKFDEYINEAETKLEEKLEQQKPLEYQIKSIENSLNNIKYVEDLDKRIDFYNNEEFENKFCLIEDILTMTHIIAV